MRTLGRMRCVQGVDCTADLRRYADSAPYGGHLISRLRRQLEVNCREAARETTLGCPLKGKANLETKASSLTGSISASGTVKTVPYDAMVIALPHL